jgi:dolichol-phosphate mannosyltransferase
MQKLLVVLPTYNERENLPLMIEALTALAIEGLHILVVDDNSPDGTGAIADQFVQERAERGTHDIHVLHRSEKSGLGAAYIAGFKWALQHDATHILQMDCDFSHQPKYIPQMITMMGQYDAVLGSRYIKGGSVDESWPLYRKALSWFANRIYVKTILGLPIHDATGGYRLWSAETLLGIDLDRVRSNGYVFQVELAYLANKLGYRMGEIAIHFPDRQLGTSKMGLSISFEAAVRVWQLLFNYRSLTPHMRRTEPYPVS